MAEPTRPPQLPWHVSSALRHDLEQEHVVISNEDEEFVLEYLACHPDMVDALSELCRLARKQLGTEATLSVLGEKKRVRKSSCDCWFACRPMATGSHVNYTQSRKRTPRPCRRDCKG